MSRRKFLEHEVVELYESTETHTELAKKYGVNSWSISRIRKGELYVDFYNYYHALDVPKKNRPAMARERRGERLQMARERRGRPVAIAPFCHNKTEGIVDILLLVSASLLCVCVVTGLALLIVREF